MSDPDLERDVRRIREGYRQKLPGKLAELAWIEEQLERLLSGAAPDRVLSWSEIEQALDRARAAARSQMA